MQEALETVAAVGIAVAAGVLIGLEREQADDAARDPSGHFGGVRTYALIALSGALGGWLGRALGHWVPLLVIASVSAWVGLAYLDDLRRGRARGLTTEVAALVTCLLGVLAATRGLVEPVERRVVTVAALAVVVTVLLSSKPKVKRFVEQVSREDFYATLQFLIVAVIVLPLLPNRTFGPLDVLNPFQLGLMVVLIAGLSFLGYVASRFLGSGKGVAVTALLGGMVSSTAITLSFAGRARRDAALVASAALAIVLASSVMFLRILIEVAVVHPPLLAWVATPVLGMAVLGGLASLVAYRRTRGATGAAEEVPLSNPFELGSAVRFGLLFALVLLASKAAQVHAGATGIYAAAVLAGLTDVDAITLSTARLAREGLDPRVAATTVLLGAVSNTLVKAGLAAVLGGAALGRRVGAAVGAMLVGAALGTLGLWVLS